MCKKYSEDIFQLPMGVAWHSNQASCLPEKLSRLIRGWYCREQICNAMDGCMIIAVPLQHASRPTTMVCPPKGTSTSGNREVYLQAVGHSISKPFLIR